MNHDEAVQIAHECLSSAQRPSSVYEHMLDCGLSREQANAALEEAMDRMAEKKRVEKQKQKTIFRCAGFGLLAIGLSMLAYTISLSKPGSMYIIPAGLIGYGTYMLATGDHKPSSGY